jgi:predicted nucleotidyltransferase
VADNLQTMVEARAVERIRAERQTARLEWLKGRVNTVHRQQGPPTAEVLLFGSLSQDDWDGLSDVDLLVISERRFEAEGLADALLSACLDQARNDLGMADLATANGFHAQACFFASQAAQKALKSLLIELGEAPCRPCRRGICQFLSD